jgi:hypothetical protein
MVVMYLVIPVAACAITIAILGGWERFLPAALRGGERAAGELRREHH